MSPLPHSGVHCDLRPYAGVFSDGWQLEGNVFKPRGAPSSAGWQISPKEFRPCLSSTQSDGFQVEGAVAHDVPPPVLAVAAGLIPALRRVS